MSEWLARLRAAVRAKRSAYRAVFTNGPDAQLVLRDLALFCRAHETTMHPDARMHAMAEGRREVWLHLQKHLRLSPDQLWSLYARGSDSSE